MPKQFAPHACMFADNGYVLDIHIRGAVADDWLKLIPHLNAAYDVRYHLEGGKTVTEIPLAQIREGLENKNAYGSNFTLLVGDLQIGCGIFGARAAEFYFKPDQVKDDASFATLLDFMFDIAQVVHKPVVLTPGNVADIEFISVAVNGMGFGG